MWRPWILGSAGDRRDGAYGRWDRRREAISSNQEVDDLIISRWGDGGLIWGLQAGSREDSLFETISPANPSVNVTVRPVLRWRKWGPAMPANALNVKLSMVGA